MATLSLQNVVKIFPGGIRAVDDLSMDVADGERIVLAGPSGSGKSTSLRLIAGLEQLGGGKISIDGRTVDYLPPQQRDVAMVFQHHALYPHLNVFGNLAFGLKLRRMAKSEIEQRIAETAAMLGIAELLERKPWQLSGGQRQRVALGRAIACRPKIFLLDEPLSHLDAGLREQMRHEIVRLQEQLGTTMIYVSHDQTEAMTIGRRVAVLHNGRIQQIADPATLYHHPANRFVASLIGSPAMNFFTGRIELRGDTLVFESSTDKKISWPITPRWKAALEIFRGKDVLLGVRPEHFSLERSDCGENSLNIPGTVKTIETLGAESNIYIIAGSLQFVCRACSDHGASVGDRVRPAAREEQLYFFKAASGKSISYEQ